MSISKIIPNTKYVNMYQEIKNITTSEYSTIGDTIKEKLSKIESLISNTSSETIETAWKDAATSLLSSVTLESINASIEDYKKTVDKVIMPLGGEVSNLKENLNSYIQNTEKYNELVDVVNSSQEPSRASFTNQDGIFSQQDYENAYYKWKTENERITQQLQTIKNAIDDLSNKIDSDTIKINNLLSNDTKETTKEFTFESAPEVKNNEEKEELLLGTYTKNSYTASNGKRINYYIYVPKNIKEMKSVPLHLYMTGSGEVANANSRSLPKQLNEGMQASGVVVTLEASVNKDYGDVEYLKAAKELSDYVVKKYNIDNNRISLSGHSLGGAGTLHLAEAYPNYFSVVVPVSGFNTARGRMSGNLEKGLNSLASCNVLAISGSDDYESRSSIANLKKALNNRNNNFSIKIINGGHNIQDNLYKEEFVINGRKYKNLLEYCFSVERKNS